MTVQHLPCFDHVTDECTTVDVQRRPKKFCSTPMCLWQDVTPFCGLATIFVPDITWVRIFISQATFLCFSAFGWWVSWLEWSGSSRQKESLQHVGDFRDWIQLVMCCKISMYAYSWICTLYIYSITYIFLEVQWQWLLLSMIISWFLCVKYSKTSVLWVPPVYCWLQMACPVGVYSFARSIVWEIDTTYATYLGVAHYMIHIMIAKNWASTFFASA